jgi:hypothetical protein
MNAERHMLRVLPPAGGSVTVVRMDHEPHERRRRFTDPEREESRIEEL